MLRLGGRSVHDMASSQRPTLLSLCSGIGGLDLGIEQVLGTRVVAYCERDPYAATVLLERMETQDLEPAPVWCGDVREFDLAPFVGRVDVVSAGYPCQPFSVAGKRGAESDPRHLWPEVLRVVRQVGARVLVAENVRGHLSLGFDRVLADLADAGFDAEWTVVRASDAGAPHRRERLFFVAYRDMRGRGRLEERELPHIRDAQQRDDAERCDGCVGNPQRPRLEERRPGALPGAFPAAWPPGPSGDWTGIPEWCHPATEPDVRGVAHGLSARVDRLRCLGNAVVPAQAALALRELLGR